MNTDMIRNLVKTNIKQIIILFTALLLLLVAFRGDISENKLKYQKERTTQINSPFELSNSSARFALTEAIVKNRTFFLSEDLARFSSPDVVDYNGKFMSIFTPGVSLLVVPFYWLGSFFGLEQALTYFAVTLFSFANIFLVAKLAMVLGVKKPTAVVGGLVFAFATNSLAYTQTLTQHQISTTLILLGLIYALKPKSIGNLVIFGLVYGLSSLVDFPNIMILFPALIYVVANTIQITKKGQTVEMAVNLNLIFAALALIPTLIIFAYYNYETTGSYTLLAQNIGRSKLFDDVSGIQNPSELITDLDDNNASKELRPFDIGLPFKSRAMLNGFYILLLSDERAWAYYFPVLLLGIIGYIYAFKSTSKKTAMIVVSTILINILLYAMFGDPWGGWAFGPRYLLPSAALMCVGIAISLNKLYKSLLFTALFFLLLAKSVYISTAGAFTSQAIPPKIEAEALDIDIPYTYELNLRKIEFGESSNLLYNYITQVHDINFHFYVIFYTFVVILTIALAYYYSIKDKEESL